MRTVALREVLESSDAGYWGGEPGSSEVDVAVVRNGDVLASGDVRWGSLPVRGFSEREASRAQLREGDLLLTTSGYCGQVAYVGEKPSVPTCASNFVRRLRVDHGSADSRFLFHAMNRPAFRDALAPFVRGTTMQNLALKEASESVQVPLPSIEEQRRIAAILDHADDLRAKRRASLALLDSLVTAAFQKASTGETVTETRVGDVAIVQGGLQVTRERVRNPLEVPYLRVANVHRGRLDLSEIKTMRVTAAEVVRTRLTPDDLLVVEGHGNRDEVGRVARWHGALAECVHQNHLIRVRVNPTLADADFVATFLNSEGGRRSLLRAARTTSGLNTISVSDVKDVVVRLPSLDVQRMYRATIERLLAERSAYEAHATHLDELFASLQHRAFRGEL